MKPDAAHLLTDTPISAPEEDLLGRDGFAERLALALLGLNVTDGFVFGVHGDWGSGKTSVLNLVTHHVLRRRSDEGAQEVIVVPFNPWWYGDGDDLLLRLLATIGQAIGKHDPSGGLARLSRSFLRLSAVLAPLKYVPGTAEVAAATSNLLGDAGRATATLADGLKSDASAIRDDIARILGGGQQTILVVIDDIDRLAPAETCRLFSVIKAVANLPHTIYLLAFDRKVVAESIRAELGIDGEAYIEKVVQATADLPLPNPQRLSDLVTTGLDELYAEWQPTNWEVERWANTYLPGIRRLITTPRNMKRYLNAVRLTCSGPLRQELNPVDVFALEALRLFAPSTYAVVRDNQDAFAGGAGRNPLSSMDEDGEKDARARALDGAPAPSRESVSRILRQVFPRFAASLPGGTAYGSEWEGRWRRLQRACAPDVFPVYFRLAIPEGGVSRQMVAAVLECAESPEMVASRLRDAVAADPANRLRLTTSLLTRLEDHAEEDIPASAIPTFLQGLFLVADEIIAHDRAVGMLVIRADINILRLTHQLLMRVPDPSERLAILKRLAEEAPSLCAVVHRIGIEEDQWEEIEAGRRPPSDATIPKEGLSGLKSLAVERIAERAAARALTEHSRLPLILRAWRDWAESDAAVREWVENTVATDDGLVALLVAVANAGSAQTVGSYHQTTIWHSDREFIESMVDDAEGLETRVRNLGQTYEEETAEWTALDAYLHDKERRR